MSITHPRASHPAFTRMAPAAQGPLHPRPRLVAAAAIAAGMVVLGVTLPLLLPAQGSLAIPAELVAMAQATRDGGLFMIEVAGDGRVVAFTASVPLESVPASVRTRADQVAPGGAQVGAERQVIEGRPYFEVEKVIDGLRVDLLFTVSGELAGSEVEMAIAEAPAAVLGAAHAVMPEGTVVSVERVTGPETLGGPEHHVKKQFAGEVTRIRVTESGHAEKLRKLRSEFRVAPR